MIKFDDKTMTKATLNQEFVFCDEKFGIALNHDDNPADEFSESYEGQECWVFDNVECADLSAGSAVFIYIPEMDYATVVFDKYVVRENKSNKQGEK